MTYILTGEENENQELIERTHDDLATEHGRSNVLVVDVDGETVSIVGDGIGEVDPVEVDTHDVQYDPPIPEYWENTDKALIPLFETSKEWFENTGYSDTFEMSSFGTGSVHNLTPHGIEFRRFESGHIVKDHLEGWKDKFTNNSEINGVNIVSTRADAYQSKKRSTWIDIENHNDMWISEYIPFDHRVTTTEELRSELNDILDHTPDFDALFEATEVRIDELHTPVFG
jgi:hypothetical protein